MISYFKIVLLFLVSATLCVDAKPIKSEKVPDFQKSNWGDSLEKVTKVESNKLKKIVGVQEDTWQKHGTLHDFEGNVIYTFIDRSLHSGAFFSYWEYKDFNYHLGQFFALSKKITADFGEHKDLVMQFSDKEKYKNNEELWDEGFKLGEIKIISMWQKEDTEVVLILSNIKGLAAFEVQYTSISLRDKKKK